MKPSKTAIKEYLERLNKGVEFFEKKAAELSRALKKKEELETEVSELENMTDDDDSTIQRIVTVRVRLERCVKTIERIETETALDREASQTLSPLIHEGERLAQAVLMGALEQRRNVISRAFAVFCHDNGAAENLAMKSDAYRSAFHEITRYSLLASSFMASPDRAAELIKAKTILANVLGEALKEKPDLMQFFPSRPADVSPAE